MTPSSLIGMSQGSRKRAIRVELLARGEDPHRPWLPGAVAPLQARYRLGQRLRPCRGCLNCHTTTTAAAELKAELLKVAQERGDDVCSGDGVLLARRQYWTRKEIDAATKAGAELLAELTEFSDPPWLPTPAEVDAHERAQESGE